MILQWSEMVIKTSQHDLNALKHEIKQYKAKVELKLTQTEAFLLQYGYVLCKTAFLNLSSWDPNVIFLSCLTLDPERQTCCQICLEESKEVPTSNWRFFTCLIKK